MDKKLVGNSKQYLTYYTWQKHVPFFRKLKISYAVVHRIRGFEALAKRQGMLNTRSND